MDVKFLSHDNENYSFLIKGARYDFINAVRRTIVSHVKTMAVDNVLVYKNESVMPDEFLAHRIGLVPLYISSFNDDSKMSLYLNKTSGLVKSSDIDGDVEIYYKNIPIVELNEGKSLELELVLRASSGSEHTKWSPALVYFNNMFKFKQLEKIDKELAKEIPSSFADVKDGEIILKDEFNFDSMKFLELILPNKVKVNIIEDEYIFNIEPFGNLPIAEIISGVSEDIVSKLNNLREGLKKI